MSTRAALVAVCVASSATLFGYDTTTVVTGLGVGGITVGFALQQTISDFFACSMILVYRPFNVGDYVDLGGGLSGTVLSINFRTCTIQKLDCGQQVR